MTQAIDQAPTFTRRPTAAIDYLNRCPWRLKQLPESLRFLEDQTLIGNINLRSHPLSRETCVVRGWPVLCSTAEYPPRSKLPPGTLA